MQLDVTSTEAELDTSDYTDQEGKGQILVLQNLGTGAVYFDFLEGVDDDTGVKIASGASFQIPNWSTAMRVFVMSDTTADLRYAVAG